MWVEYADAAETAEHGYTSVTIWLGRIVAMCCRASTLYRNR